MATLSAKIGDRELSTMVSTTDLNVTTGKVMCPLVIENYVVGKHHCHYEGLKH